MLKRFISLVRILIIRVNLFTLVIIKDIKFLEGMQKGILKLYPNAVTFLSMWMEEQS